MLIGGSFQRGEMVIHKLFFPLSILFLYFFFEYGLSCSNHQFLSTFFLLLTRFYLKKNCWNNLPHKCPLFCLVVFYDTYGFGYVRLWLFNVLSVSQFLKAEKKSKKLKVRSDKELTLSKTRELVSILARNLINAIWR